MFKFVIFIWFLNFLQDVCCMGEKQLILTKQLRFTQLRLVSSKNRSAPELSEDDAENDQNEGGEGDDEAGGDDLGDDTSGSGESAREGSGNPRTAETEENLRLDAWSIFRNLDEFMIVQNQRLMDALYGDAMEQNEEMEELVYDLNDNLDHWTYKIYSKFAKSASALQDSRYTSAKTAITAIDSQIKKATQQLRIYQGQVYRLEDQLHQEEESCSSFYTCKECLMNEGCGWCPLVDKCVAGNENGPLFQKCQYYNYQFCQGKQCLKYDACNTCLSDPDCGWCQVDDENIRVCLQQPRNFEGCPEGHWHHIAGQQFFCPYKKEKEILDEEVPSDKFWMRPKAKPPACSPAKVKQVSKIKKERQEYNDKSEYKEEKEKVQEVKINYKQTISQKVVELKVLIEDLTNRKDEIQAYVDEYIAQRGIEVTELEDQIEDQGEETPQQEENNEQSQDTTTTGGNKIQIKKEKKKKKIVQIFYEEQISQEEEETYKEEVQEMQEEIEEGEEEIEYVFEMSKDYKVDIREHQNSKPIRNVRKSNYEDEENKKYHDQGDRNIEGDIDSEYYNQRFVQEQQQKHFRDFLKYYPK